MPFPLGSYPHATLTPWHTALTAWDASSRLKLRNFRFYWIYPWSFSSLHSLSARAHCSLNTQKWKLDYELSCDYSPSCEVATSNIIYFSPSSFFVLKFPLFVFVETAMVSLLSIMKVRNKNLHHRLFLTLRDLSYSYLPSPSPFLFPRVISSSF